MYQDDSIQYKPAHSARTSITIAQVDSAEPLRSLEQLKREVTVAYRKWCERRGLEEGLTFRQSNYESAKMALSMREVI